MILLNDMPIWLTALMIFFLRVIDVTMGTFRTLSVVQGHVKLSVVLGFLEVLIWIFAISQVITRVGEHPLLAFAFAGGFAAGNAVGITLERRVGLGACVIRMISMQKGSEVAGMLRSLGQVVTTFQGEGRDGIRTLLYAACERRDARRLVEEARKLDPQILYFVEHVSESTMIRPLPHATGWRAISKKK